MSNFSKTIREAKYRRGFNSRMRGNLIHLDMYIKSTHIGNKHGYTCKVCGNMDYSECYICGVYLNLMANIGKSEGRTCFFDYHNDSFFGLAREDVGLSKKISKD